jgi:hypothetical protein
VPTVGMHLPGPKIVIAKKSRRMARRRLHA